MTGQIIVTDKIRDDNSDQSKRGMSFEQLTFEPCLLFIVVLCLMFRHEKKARFIMLNVTSFVTITGIRAIYFIRLD